MGTTSSSQHGSLPNRFKDKARAIVDFKAYRNGFSRLPTNLRAYGRDTWLDSLTPAMIGAIALGLFFAPHTFIRYFPVYFKDGVIVYPTLAYPYTEPIISSVGAALIAGIIPVGVIIIAQIWVYDFYDANNALLGLAYSMYTATCFQVILKTTIGGLRPHFLSVCQPNIPENTVGAGFQHLMFSTEICSGDKKMVKNATESFPSGHAATAWAGLFYLSIYLFTHLHILGPRRPSHWKMLCVIAPIVLAVYVSSTLVLGYHHHAYDVIFGGLIGGLMAILAYRMCFRSLSDPRTNWQPLIRGATAEAVDDPTPAPTMTPDDGPVLPRYNSQRSRAP